MKSDIEIAREATMVPVTEVAAGLGLSPDDLDAYGKYKAKIHLDVLDRLQSRPDGKLVLCTAITPTPAGEGKTTTNVGLSMGLNKIGKKAIATLREPSLGPCFGIKGGAAGGGYAQVVPMEDINLHFTGDIHAITAAHNLCAAVLDNHLFQGNELNINPNDVSWPRVVDLNDRALRQITVGQGGEGVERKTRFDITVASEIMAILCLATDMEDLKARLDRIIVGSTLWGRKVTAQDIKVSGSMAVLLKDAFMPNLVQTLENTPAIIHGGPFANIAHGCNSVQATRMALKLGDYCVTEAGFGADLGAEKFFDIKCRYAGLVPDCIVLIATIRALKMHGGVPLTDLKKENLPALASWLGEPREAPGEHAVLWPARGRRHQPLPGRHRRRGRAPSRACRRHGRQSGALRRLGAGRRRRRGTGRRGRPHLREQRRQASLPLRLRAGHDHPARRSRRSRRRSTEPTGWTITTRLLLLSSASPVWGTPRCRSVWPRPSPRCPTTKTRLGRPRDWRLTVREIRLSAGAGMVVPVCGKIMTMPGLPKHPAAENIDLINGEIVGLF